MPRSDDLPDDLKLLARRNALGVNHDRFNADSGRLVAAIERVLEKADGERKQREEKKDLGILKNATKDRPWQSSLGMNFVPISGTSVLFSIWDTPVQDYERFSENAGRDATGGMWSLGRTGTKFRKVTWKKPGFEQVGLSSEPGRMPEGRDSKIEIFPWGKDWAIRPAFGVL